MARRIHFFGGSVVALAILVPTAACTKVLGDFEVGVLADGGTNIHGGDDDGSCTGCTNGGDGSAGDDDGSSGDDGPVDAVTLAISPTNADLSRGDMIMIAVDLSGPLTSSVDIVLASAPVGVTADAVRLSAGMTSATLTVHVGLAAAAGTSTIIVAARVPGRTVADAGAPVVVDAGAPDAKADAGAAPGDAGATSDAGKVATADAGGAGSTNVGMVLPGDITASFALTVEGSNGGPDPTFGAGGVLVVKVSASSDTPLGLAFDSKGNIIIVGQRGTPAGMVLARVTTAGVLDTTYGTMGYAVTGLTGTTGSSLALRSDDGVFAAGTATTTSSLLASFTSAGQLDTTFAAGKGYVTVDGAGASTVVNAVALAGTTVVVGGERTLGTRSQGMLLGFTAAGAFVDQAASPGALPTAVGSLVGNGVNGLWIGGLTASGGSGSPFDSLALGRVVAGQAEFDTTFGTSGFASSVNSGSDYSGSVHATGRVAKQSTGRIVVAGTPVDGSSTLTAFVTSGTAAGAVDTTFGMAGSVSNTMGSTNDIVADSADRLIIVGDSFNLQRFSPVGVLDATFDDNLPATPVFVAASATRAAIDPQGRLVVIGTGQTTAGDDDWVIARFLP